MEINLSSNQVQTAVVLLLILKTAMCAEEKHSQSQLHDLDQFIKHTLKCQNIPGLAISLVKDDGVIFSRGYGYADKDKGVKAKEHTKFCIGSLTKAFTATVIASVLAEHKNLTWDTPIWKILGPSFHLSDSLRTENVNLRDLLAHKVGTPAYFHPLLVGYPSVITRKDLVRRLQYMPAVGEFRTEFHYSNYMYMLAGHVAEVITGESWEDMVKSRLIGKLGMRDTGFIDKLSNMDDIVTPYVHKGGKLKPVNKELLLTVTPLGPAGSIYSTASDMSKWMMFHLNNGRSVHGHQLVNSHLLNETYNAQMAHPFSQLGLTRPKYPIADVSISYNMGWMSSNYRGYKKLWHSGGIVTFSNMLWLFPDMKAGVFVTASGPLENDAVKTITARAADLLIGKEPWLNLTTACTYPAPWGVAKSKTFAKAEISYKWNISCPMKAYEGVYEHEAFGNISIKVVNNSNLILKYGRFGLMKLQPRSETTFNGYFIDKLWFITNSDNQKPHEITFVFVKDSTKASEIILFDNIHFRKDLYDRPLSDTSVPSVTSLPCDSGPNAYSVTSGAAMVPQYFLLATLCVYYIT